MRGLTFFLAFAALLAAATSSPAQTPPSDRDLRVYAGLHAAAAVGDVAEIEKLIKEGENPNLQDSNSRTPLLVAAYRKHHDAVRALLRLGANPKGWCASWSPPAAARPCCSEAARCEGRGLGHFRRARLRAWCRRNGPRACTGALSLAADPAAGAVPGRRPGRCDGAARRPA